MAPDTTVGEWRKSSQSSGQNGDCVEVNPAHGIRDSKNPGDRLGVSWNAVQALVAKIKTDDLDQ